MRPSPPEPPAGLQSDVDQLCETGRGGEPIGVASLFVPPSARPIPCMGGRSRDARRRLPRACWARLRHVL